MPLNIPLKTKNNVVREIDDDNMNIDLYDMQIDGKGSGHIVDFDDINAEQFIDLDNKASDPGVAGRIMRNGADVKFHDGTAARTLCKEEATSNLVPSATNSKYLGSWSKAYKGVYLYDATLGVTKLLRIDNGAIKIT